MRPQRIIVVCQNERPPGARECCAHNGSAELLAALRRVLKERGLKGQLRAVGSTCLGACEGGPHAVVYPDGVWYAGLGEADAAEIVERHLVGGEPVDRLRVAAPFEEPG